ncbi:hypothetical protein CDD82_6984 [Ophiocordyceps australis]|uniref:Transcriptional regulator n=1 Tax=Ophiocordyceps australis TaxID=1399860 RepID=A0A2C5YVF0_9HYPO|nr:hypothetical protein CDD82_6984 [Ophiocordyceps australis]
MFLPSVHVEEDPALLHQLIRDNPLGIITTALPSNHHPFILSSHIPWVLDVDPHEPHLARLRGHLARQNPQSQVLMQAAAHSGATIHQELLVLFTAAPQHYVTPHFYVETKPLTGKVVPTWNYAAVEAYGKATVYFDSHSDQTSRFLNRQMHDLSQHAETYIMGYTGRGDRPDPWKVTDAPERYIEVMKKSVIGIEIVIHRLQGKFKMSQEKGKADSAGIVHGFLALDSDMGRAMASLVKERSHAEAAATP